MAKGLTVYVARTIALGDCTNGGLSAKHDRLTVVGYVDITGQRYDLPERAQVFEATDDAPAALLVVRNIGGRILSIVPEDGADPGARWYMMGGNYASLGDSRLCDLARNLIGGAYYGAVPIHDRHEEWGS